MHQAQVLLAAGNPDIDAAPVWRKVKLIIFYLRSETVFWHTADEMATHRYRGRDITGEEILFIRQLIEIIPELSRWKLSRELCEAWQWKQANGALRDMVCRGLLLMLDRAGEIELPPVKRGCAIGSRSGKARARGPRQASGARTTGSITPLEFVQVRRTPEEALFNSLMEQYHYLGYEQPIGEHLKYLVKANGQVIACPAWQSAPRHLKVRDRYIGWSEEARQRNVHLLAYNTRFLILPWVEWNIWPRTFWGAWRSLFRKTGNGSTRIRFIGWRRSSIPRVFVGRVIARPTGK